MKRAQKSSHPPLAFRLPDALIDRLDAYVEQLAAETGISVTRADAVRKLLGIGLDHVGGAASKRRK
jgi:hypothetical protein